MTISEKHMNPANMGAFSKAKELQKKILFVLLALIVYRLGTFIPLPGIDGKTFEEIFSQNILKVRIEISKNFDNRVISFQSTDNRSKELMKSIKKSYKKKNEYISN